MEQKTKGTVPEPDVGLFRTHHCAPGSVDSYQTYLTEGSELDTQGKKGM
jgi:hypothetical protein